MRSASSCSKTSLTASPKESPRSPRTAPNRPLCGEGVASSAHATSRPVAHEEVSAVPTSMFALFSFVNRLLNQEDGLTLILVAAAAILAAGVELRDLAAPSLDES